jgi:hypothetical protein
LAAVAARSSLIGALLRTTTPVNTSSALSFLRGLSRDELACIAEFHGACMLEASESKYVSPYRFLSSFFDLCPSGRWRDADDRAHKTFVVLTWLEYLNLEPVRVHSAASPV